MPQVILLAGPNGAGKSTLAARLVPRGVPFLNADEIARERAAPPGPSAELAAGRTLIQRLGQVEDARQSFALETNLASRTLAARIPRWQAVGYHVALVFVWLPSADMAVQRVAARVRAGGHDIPEATIRRRYRVGLGLFRPRHSSGQSFLQVRRQSKAVGPLPPGQQVVRSAGSPGPLSNTPLHPTRHGAVLGGFAPLALLHRSARAAERGRSAHLSASGR